MPVHVHALFIGNSFTARNDVPGLIAAIAEAHGDQLTHRLLSIGGASLRTHWNKGEALRAIQSRVYDTVVLQEQSTLPVKNASRMHENVRLFDATVREAGARMVLYLTWARRHAPQSQAAITEAYTSIAGVLDAAVAPAGIAWERTLAAHPEITLHDKDGSHPNLAGSYLAACVLFATLFKETPVGALPPPPLDVPTAEMLQSAAWTTVRTQHKSQDKSQRPTGAAEGSRPTRPRQAPG
jgi:hypothetical protein